MECGSCGGAFDGRWTRCRWEGDEQLRPKAVPLGMPAVDKVLGGGIPRGRTSVFVGEPSSGKTLLAQLTIAAAQRAGGKAIFVDVEHTFDPDWFALTGVEVDPKKLLILRPRNLEQGFDMITEALDDVRPDVLVLDSIPALIPDDMLKAKMAEKDFRGLAARKITEGVGKITQANVSTAVILINQLRIDMSVTYGNPERMPGGKALRFYASLIVRLRRGKWLTDQFEDEDDLPDLDEIDPKDVAFTGFMLKLRTDKNKQAAPFQQTEVKFYFSGKIDPLSSFIELAIRGGLITKRGSFYEITDANVARKFHGISNLEEYLRECPELLDEMVNQLHESG